MATLEENIAQAISDFDDIEAALIEQGVDVPSGTDTSEYGNKIRSIPRGGGVGGTVDQTYNPESTNAQSGIAVAEALAGLPIKYVENLDSSNPIYLRDMESGTYILYGKFKPFNGSTGTFTFSTGMLVSIQKATAMTYVQVFYSKNNTIQYLEITDETYTRKDAKLVDMESKANLTTIVDATSDDNHYPSAKAVYDFCAQLGGNTNTPIKTLESLDTENIMSMRDIEDGYYIMTGYFHPYPNSDSTLIVDGLFTSVARREEGSHIMTISPLNFRITCYEVLVDETAEDGFTYESWRVSLLDLLEDTPPASPARIVDIELLADKWVGTESPYSQVVDISGVTEHSQVDLTPSVEQLSIFYNKNLAFVTENEDGIVTVYAIGQKPTNDYTMQATVTEVNV